MAPAAPRLRPFATALLVALVSTSPAAAQSFVHEDVRPNVIWNPSLAVDAASDQGGMLALDFDAQDRPHVAYPWNGQLKHAWRDAQGWHSEVVDPALGADPYLGASLVVDALDRVNVSYHRGTTPVFARRNAGGWTLTAIPNAEAYVGTSLGVDASGIACFSYTDLSGIRLAQESAGGWTTLPIESGSMGNPSLALDAAGHPHVSYYDGGNGVFKYATRPASGVWTRTVVDDHFRSGQRGTMTLDGAGRPEFAYTVTGYTGGLLRFAFATPVTAVGEPGARPALALAPLSPNPSPGGAIAFAFTLREAADVSIGIYDVGGRRIAAREDERFEAGPARLQWDPGLRLPGLYLVRVTTSAGERAEQRWVMAR